MNKQDNQFHSNTGSYFIQLEVIILHKLSPYAFSWRIQRTIIQRHTNTQYMSKIFIENNIVHLVQQIQIK